MDVAVLIQGSTYQCWQKMDDLKTICRNSLCMDVELGKCGH